MLTSIDVVGDPTQPGLHLNVVGQTMRDSIQIQGITGLGPPDGTLFIGDYARDGGVYTGRRFAVRNPVITVQLNPNYALEETYEGLRDILYSRFMSPRFGVDTDMVTVVLHDSEKSDRYFSGYVDKFTNEIFGSDTTLQIGMQCPDPYIRDATPTEYVGSWTILNNVVYPGSAPSGFETDITFFSSAGTITLENNGQKMPVTFPFLPGDKLFINTNPGAREISYIRPSVSADKVYILYALDPTAPWIQLQPGGTNTFKVYRTVAGGAVDADITRLIFTSAFWGV